MHSKVVSEYLRRRGIETRRVLLTLGSYWVGARRPYGCHLPGKSRAEA